MIGEKRCKTKNKILVTSKELFYIHGYKNTKFDMISEMIGKPKSLINYHFSKKQDILIVIMKDFLEEIYEYVNSSLDCHYLLKYFVFNQVYYNLFNYDHNTTRFHIEILNRKDRTIDVYKNFDIILNDMTQNMNLNLSMSHLALKQIAIFGSNHELLHNYYNGVLDITMDQVIELISIHTCKILGISNLLINEYLPQSNKIYNSLEVCHLNLFKQGDYLE